MPAGAAKHANLRIAKIRSILGNALLLHDLNCMDDSLHHDHNSLSEIVHSGVYDMVQNCGTLRTSSNRDNLEVRWHLNVFGARQMDSLLHWRVSDVFL